MLFIFLLDNDELMNEIKFPSSYSMENVLNREIMSLNSYSKSIDTFLPTSMDASIYFIQQYSKVNIYNAIYLLISIFFSLFMKIFLPLEL